MKIEIRDNSGSLLTSFDVSDTKLQTNPTLLQLDVIDDQGKKARGFVAAELTKRGCRFEIVGKKKDASENIGHALASFK